MLPTRYSSKYDPLAQPCMSLIGNQYMLTKVGSKSVQRKIKKVGYKVNNPARLQPACAHTGHVISKDDDDRLKTILGCVSKDDNKIKTMLLGRVKSEDDNKLKSFQAGFLKNLKSLYRFTRPNTLNGLVIAVTSICCLPLQNLGDLTPTFFMEVFKTVVPAALMAIYMTAINQLVDVKIDKINKPDLPLASGDFSIKTGVAITLTCAMMSLAMGIMIGSPPLAWGLILWFILVTAYSIDLPFLRWKRNAFLAAISIMIGYGVGIQFSFFIHIQKYVLGRPVVITRSLIFTTGVITCMSLAKALLKDLHDVDGDKEYGIRTFSVVLGKERVFRVGVYMLLITYGAAAIFGAYSSSLLSKLITIISHCAIASFLWFRAQMVDLSENASILSFYMFIWKLYEVEYLLIHFAR
ncbi:homogentisate phytyltransferase 1 [Citrus sinensis]|uniref:Homogentisate phytyltransferase 1 n=1 Tax=Citrus sinensis TaxID=2711 RepID=A0ACB8I2F9_CITSI|nr:homogentisate phytyltransferase 1 [Citrus sinensis]